MHFQKMWLFLDLPQHHFKSQSKKGNRSLFLRFLRCQSIIRLTKARIVFDLISGAGENIHTLVHLYSAHPPCCYKRLVFVIHICCCNTVLETVLNIWQWYLFILIHMFYVPLHKKPKKIRFLFKTKTIFIK